MVYIYAFPYSRNLSIIFCLSKLIEFRHKIHHFSMISRIFYYVFSYHCFRESLRFCRFCFHIFSYVFLNPILKNHFKKPLLQPRRFLSLTISSRIRRICHKIVRSKLNFIPFPITTFGELSEHASAFVGDAAVFYSAHQQLSFGDSRTQLLQRIEVALMQQVGRRLLACCSVLHSESTTAAVA